MLRVKYKNCRSILSGLKKKMFEQFVFNYVDRQWTTQAQCTGMAIAYYGPSGQVSF